MSDRKVYEALAYHLNEDPSTKFPVTEEFLEMLEILFTPKQAEVARFLPTTNMGRITGEEFAKRANREAEETKEIAESMAKAGTVMANVSRKDGNIYYALWPMIPGMMESTYADGIENEQRQRLSKLWEKYFDAHFLNSMSDNAYPINRIIPINVGIDSNSKVLPFETASNLIMAADVITVIPCHCRAVMKKCNHIMEADFVFGAWANYLINYRGARKWTKEEALQRLKECEEDGLVHLTGNAQKGLDVICNCCPCCCGALRGIVEFNNSRSVAHTNFVPGIHQAECFLCLKCVEVCPTKAITEAPGIASDGSEIKLKLEESLCIGCGLCAAQCNVAAIRMVKVREELPEVTVADMIKRVQAGKES